MKIHLITGATGFVGRYLTNALLERGDTVWIIVRSLNGVSAQSRTKEIFRSHSSRWPTAFRVIEGDITVEDLGVPAYLAEELEAHEVTFWHLAASLTFSSENMAEVQRTNLGGTAHAVAFANKVAHSFMHMSTAYVCGNSSSFSESDLSKGQKFRNPYEQSKLAGETYVHENCKLPYTIFRPSVIIGDAYRGKAEGCTFGYYRYVFMFYFFKKQIIKVLQKDNVSAFLLRVLGTRYDTDNDILSVPWLVIPYP